MEHAERRPNDRLASGAPFRPRAQRALPCGPSTGEHSCWALTALAATALGAVALVAPSSASAWCQMTTRSERPPEDSCLFAEPPDSYPLAWRQRCTSISLSRLGSTSLPEDRIRAVLRRSIDTWEQVECPGGGTTGLHVEILPELNECESASHFTDSGNVHSVVFISEGWVDERMHNGDAYAVTLVWHDPRSGAIWDVDMEINEELTGVEPGPAMYGECDGVETCPDGIVDLQNVVTHEMGHYFGLAHTPVDTLATMYAMAVSDETLKRTLEPDDIEGLCAIYPPGALPETCDVTPRGGLNLACERSGCDCGIAGAGPDRSQPAIAMLGLIGMAVALRRRRASRFSR